MPDVFLSYSRQDQPVARYFAEGLGREGLSVWWDQALNAGEAFDRVTEKALEDARAVVVLWSKRSVDSDWVRAEATRAQANHRLVPVEIEPCKRPIKFELTHTADLAGWNGNDADPRWRAFIEGLKRFTAPAGQLQSAAAAESTSRPAVPAQRPRSKAMARPWAIAAAAAVILVLGTGAWLLFRPVPAVGHATQVRLAGFQQLSADLPAGIPDAMRDEIIAAFANDGTIGVSTATSPPPGSGPAYVLGGTIRREDDKIKVIARLTNERSGANLWSDSLIYDAGQIPRIPRKVAVVAGNMVRCGLFAAATYPRALADPVMSDYLQYCQNNGLVEHQPTRALDFAHKVVAAAPDFSWGWSAVANASMLAAVADPTAADARAQRAEGLEAANKALQLDPTNSEALGDRSLMLDFADLAGREQLLRQALAARPQSCGCEHFVYGNLLREVGRFEEAIVQFRRATELNPLDADLQWGLADALLVTGRPAEARPHLDLARDLAKDADYAASLVLAEALLTGDLAGALGILRDPLYGLSKGESAALIAGFEALQSHDPQAKARAIRLLTGTRFGADGAVSSNLLAALGANEAALKAVSEAAADQVWSARSWLFYPTMAPALRDPGFPALAQRLGLMPYWETTHTRPDVCSAKDPPPFCRMI